MAGLWVAIRALLARIFGKSSDTQRQLRTLEAMEEKCMAARRDNTDSWETLKGEIRAQEIRALQKKKEHEEARGSSKRLLVGEIEAIFREMDRLRPREKLIAANLHRIGLAFAKIKEAKVALQSG